MTEKLSSLYQEIVGQAAAVLKALADPNRLRIFELLMQQGDACNRELNERLGLSPNLLSHHLRVLREAGLIRSRQDARDGRWVYYSIDTATVSRWCAWFAELLNPARARQRAVLCGPAGQQATVPLLSRPPDHGDQS